MSSEYMNELSAEITKLTELWYRLVQIDHHKDRDCHWGIDMVWSYGETPKFRIWHEGYVNRRISYERSNMRDALDSLRAELKSAIESQVSWAHSAVSEDNYMSEDEAKKVLGIVSEWENG